MKLKSFLASLAMCMPLVANAVPVQYDVTFTGTGAYPNSETTTPNIGGPGSGSFYWDSNTSEISDFIFDFSGVTGFLWPNVAPSFWSQPAFGGTVGQFFFESLTGQDVHPWDCNGVGACTTTISACVGGSTVQAEFRSGMAGVHDPEYFFSSEDVALYGGTLTVTPAATIPGPGSLGLLAAGLFLLINVRLRFSRD